MGTQIYKSVID